MTSFEGDTGPYLQYAHARLCSMFRKSGLTEEELSTANFDLLSEKHAVDLIRLLASYPDTILNTAKTLEPVTILAYLFKMTHSLSSSYDVLKVVGSEPELKKARMALYFSARQVLHNGMRILGLNPVQRYGFLPPFFFDHKLTLRIACKIGFSFPPFLKRPSTLYTLNILFSLDAYGAISWSTKYGIFLYPTLSTLFWLKMIEMGHDRNH
jgi:hypothetical protein